MKEDAGYTADSIYSSREYYIPSEIPNFNSSLVVNKHCHSNYLLKRRGEGGRVKILTFERKLMLN